MRAFGLLVLMLLVTLPLVAAEEWNLRAGGITLGPRTGVFGAQVSNEDGAGARYWINATEGGGAVVVVVTTCYTPGSHVVSYCQRHWLHA